MAGPKMQLEDWLDDLCVRFIINLPEEDLSSVARICFQVEEAQWFYEDFIRPLDPTLPSMSLRSFCLRIFQHCPLLAPFSVENHTLAFEEFLQYKTRVPVRGAILLNEAMDSTVLVKGWKKGANWSFPRGKINKDEDDLDCAIREVDEETGFDIRAAGLVPRDDAIKYIEITMREQQMRLYVFRDVPMDTHFHPRTRKEISKIQWYRLSDLPAFRKKGNQHQNDPVAANHANKFYMVAPFLVPLKKWIVQQKKKDAVRIASESHLMPHAMPLPEETATEDESGMRPEQIQVPSRVPAIDTLEGATLELRRLLKVQPPTQGPQVTQPQAAAPVQERGASLLALLQSKPAATKTDQGPHTPLDGTTGQPPPPTAPRHHQPQHLPLANQTYPPPQFPIPLQSQWGLAGPRPAPLQGSHQPLPSGVSIPAQNLPPLVHPQPLLPQVQRTQGLFNYTTPSPNHGPGISAPLPSYHPVPGGVPNLVQVNPSSARPRPQVGTLSNQAKVLLNAFKSGTSVLDTSSPPVDSQAAKVAHARSHIDTAAAAQPYQPIPNAGVQLAPNPTQALLNGAANRVSGRPSDEHRSALLDIFKTSDSATSTNVGEHVSITSITSVAPAGPGAQTGADIFQQIQQGSQPYPPAAPSGVENIAPNAPTTIGGGESLMRLLQKSEGRAGAAATSSASPGTTLVAPMMPPLNAPGQRASPSAAGPPAPSSFPLPTMLHHRKDASSEQKQKLLSLFGKPQAPAAGVADDKGKSQDIGLSDAITRLRMASIGSGPIDPLSAPRRGSETPISPADQNFLLEYLHSATK